MDRTEIAHVRRRPSQPPEGDLDSPLRRLEAAVLAVAGRHLIDRAGPSCTTWWAANALILMACHFAGGAPSPPGSAGAADLPVVEIRETKSALRLRESSYGQQNRTRPGLMLLYGRSVVSHTHPGWVQYRKRAAHRRIPVIELTQATLLPESAGSSTEPPRPAHRPAPGSLGHLPGAALRVHEGQPSAAPEGSRRAANHVPAARRTGPSSWTRVETPAGETDVEASVALPEPPCSSSTPLSSASRARSQRTTTRRPPGRDDVVRGRCPCGRPRPRRRPGRGRGCARRAEIRLTRRSTRSLEVFCESENITRSSLTPWRRRSGERPLARKAAREANRPDAPFIRVR